MTEIALTGIDAAFVMAAWKCTRRAAIKHIRSAGGWQVQDGEWRVSQENWNKWVRANETASTSEMGHPTGGRETPLPATGVRRGSKTRKQHGGGVPRASAWPQIQPTQPRKPRPSASGAGGS